MLFTLNGIKKLKKPQNTEDEGGRMAIIQNGSSLFTGDAGSGPSEIRKYILENDMLEAIIQLPNDVFYNTGIATYIWLITIKKEKDRKEKVQLIDASHCFEPRKKSIGNKRNDLTEKCSKLILNAHNEFQNNKTYFDEDKPEIYCESKIFNYVDFGYNKIVVERPQKDENGKVILKKGKPVADANLRDTENVPLNEDIDEYFEREVLPYAPDAWIDKTKTKVGYEIPMTRYFYKYQAPEKSENIEDRISNLEKDIMSSLKDLFGGE